MINDEQIGHIQPTRRIKQGDAILPYVLIPVSSNLVKMLIISNFLGPLSVLKS